MDVDSAPCGQKKKQKREQHMYSRRSSEGEDGVEQRIQPSHFQNGQCGTP